jgi:hypothetical protein
MLNGLVRQIVVLAACLCVLARIAAADEATPSGGPRETPVGTSTSAGAATVARVNYSDAVAQVAAMYPLRLDQMSQVVQNSHNWRGPDDASVRCEVGFTAEAIVIRGDFTDDLPFHQTMLRPAMPDWWRITYGADGLEFSFDDPTSSTNRVRLALNFGSRAVNPSVDVLQSPLAQKPGPVPGASMELFDANGAEGPGGNHGAKIGFEVAVPMVAVADPRLFAGPLRISLRMHDVDGAPSTYLMMQQVIEKK